MEDVFTGVLQDVVVLWININYASLVIFKPLQEFDFDQILVFLGFLLSSSFESFFLFSLDLLFLSQLFVDITFFEQVIVSSISSRAV